MNRSGRCATRKTAQITISLPTLGVRIVVCPVFELRYVHSSGLLGLLPRGGLCDTRLRSVMDAKGMLIDTEHSSTAKCWPTPVRTWGRHGCRASLW